MTEWMKIEDLHLLLHRSLQRSNDAMLREESETHFTIAESTIELPLFTKIVGGSEGPDFYVRFPLQQCESETGRESGPECPLSRMKVTLRPTITLD